MKMERGTALSGVVFLVAIVIIAATVLLFMFGTTVHPGEIGVRNIKFGPWRGLNERPLLPGIHWAIPGDVYSVIYKIPQTVQRLDFVHDHPPSNGEVLDALEVQTSDRATVDVDVTVFTRVYSEPGKDKEPVYGDGVNKPIPEEPPSDVPHGGPRDLIKGIGPRLEQWRNHIRRTAEDELKRALGAISTAEFYDPTKREVQVSVAHRSMNRALAKNGIKVEAVLLRRYAYRDKRIDNAIFQKNLQDQEERLNVTASKFAEAQALLEQASAEWDAKILTARVEGENKSRVLTSQGELYESQKKALGDLEVAKARAEIDQLRAQALSGVPGAETYIARELASILGSLKGGVVSGIDPYNIDEWTKKLTGHESAGGK